MDELEKIKKEKMEEILKRKNIKLKIDVSDNDFTENVIEQSKTIPVLVDFWAPWCMPCTMLGPILERIVETYNGKFILAKANVEQARTMAQTYGIQSIPNVKLFKNGKPIAEFVGAVAETTIKKMLDENLG